MSTLKSTVKPKIVQIQLIDKMGSVSLLKEFGNGVPNVNISVAQLRNDIYILKISGFYPNLTEPLLLPHPLSKRSPLFSLVYQGLRKLLLTPTVHLPPVEITRTPGVEFLSLTRTTWKYFLVVL